MRDCACKWLLKYKAFVHDNDGEKLYLKTYEGGFLYVDMEFKFQCCNHTAHIKCHIKVKLC